MQIKEIEKEIERFNLERSWKQYHNPKDIIIALMSEIGELADIFRWLKADEIKKLLEKPEGKKAVEEEIADIFMYLITLSKSCNISLEEAYKRKIEKNKKKYPSEKIKGIHSNKFIGMKGK